MEGTCPSNKLTESDKGDSLVLFAALMGEAIGAILVRQEEGAHPLPFSGSMHMDDTYLWAESLPFLQKQVQQVESSLSQEGLRINGQKTECVCSHPCTGATITVGGQTMQVQGPSHNIKVLGATFTMSSFVSVLNASMQQKARVTLACNKSTFRGKDTLAHKATMSDVLIRPAALWGCGT